MCLDKFDDSRSRIRRLLGVSRSNIKERTFLIRLYTLCQLKDVICIVVNHSSVLQLNLVYITLYRKQIQNAI